MAADMKRGADDETVLVGKLDGAHISIRWDGLRVALPAQGLHVVTAADKAVLDAMARVPEETLRRALANTLHADEHSRAPARAELARRGLK